MFLKSFRLYNNLLMYTYTADDKSDMWQKQEGM